MGFGCGADVGAQEHAFRSPGPAAAAGVLEDICLAIKGINGGFC